MAFSYTLFLALILLFPGLCAWAGLRLGERTDLLTPRPDKPNSTATLFIVVMGTLVGHLLGAATFAIQAALTPTSIGRCSPRKRPSVTSPTSPSSPDSWSWPSSASAPGR